jgi:hypothetical protein
MLTYHGFDIILKKYRLDLILKLSGLFCFNLRSVLVWKLEYCITSLALIKLFQEGGQLLVVGMID